MRTLIAVFVTMLIAVSLMARSVSANEQLMPVAYEDQDTYIRTVIRTYIGYDPVLEAIFGCESTGDPNHIQHWNEDGTLVKNPGSSASGYAQVLLDFHSEWIEDEDRNMQNLVEYTLFVRTMVRERGYHSWNESKSCWGHVRQLYAQN